MKKVLKPKNAKIYMKLWKWQCNILSVVCACRKAAMVWSIFIIAVSMMPS